MSDKIYHTRKNMTWADVKRAMSRVKKFRKKGFYLEVEEQEGVLPGLNHATSDGAHVKMEYLIKSLPLYTTRLWGPIKR